jgi:caffeoyl-CoA O-methyltransferase
MSNKSAFLSDKLYEYLVDHSVREPDVLEQLREETSRLEAAAMQIAPEQGQFMQLLVRMLQARRTLEIGVFTGYSALSVALVLPSDGSVVACDVNEEWTRIARRFWRRAGVEDTIDLRLAPALETLDELLASGEEGSFDFAFIDADKREYDGYYERCLQLVRSGGLIMLDNMFKGGRVADPRETAASVQAIRDMNEKLHEDDRIHLSLVPIADGVTLALKK